MDSGARRSWGLIALAVFALAGLFFGLSGYVMAGSFTVSNPEQLEHWQRVAMMYLVVAGLSAVSALSAIIALFKRARRSPRFDPPAA